MQRRAGPAVVLVLLGLVVLAIPLGWFLAQQWRERRAAAEARAFAETLGYEPGRQLAAYTRCGNIFGSCYSYVHFVSPLGADNLAAQLAATGWAVERFAEAPAAILDAINYDTPYRLTVNGSERLSSADELAAERWEVVTPEGGLYIVSGYAPAGPATVLAFEGSVLPPGQIITVARRLD